MTDATGARDAKNVVFATYNVNYSRRAVGEYATYSWSNRVDAICQALTDTRADVIAVQEVPVAEVGDFVKRMSAYTWIFSQQNARNGVTSIGIGVRIKDDDFVKYFNEIHYDFADHIDDVNAECVVGMFDIRDKTLYLSVHFPMDRVSRMKMVEHFPKFLEKEAPSQVVIGGDFNSFPDDGGWRQMLSMNARCGTYSASEFASNLSDGTLSRRSFVPYPYDKVPAQSFALGGKLDHVLVRGFDTDLAEVWDDKVVDGSSQIAPSDHHLIRVHLKRL